MAQPTIELVNALRTTADKLAAGATYAWGNHGACNCGNLLQVVTKLSQQEIHAYAQTGIGEWTELAQEYCGVTNAPIDLLIAKLQNLGLTTSDIHNIEYLEDREVLNNLPGGFRWLSRNNKEDVIDYFNAFANVLEDKMLKQVDICFNTLLNTEVSTETLKVESVHVGEKELLGV